MVIGRYWNSNLITRKKKTKGWYSLLEYNVLICGLKISKKGIYVSLSLTLHLIWLKPELDRPATVFWRVLTDLMNGIFLLSVRISIVFTIKLLAIATYKQFSYAWGCEISHGSWFGEWWWYSEFLCWRLWNVDQVNKYGVRLRVEIIGYRQIN